MVPVGGGGSTTLGAALRDGFLIAALATFFFAAFFFVAPFFAGFFIAFFFAAFFFAIRRAPLLYAVFASTS
jgi:hypothetical protein